MATVNRRCLLIPSELVYYGAIQITTSKCENLCSLWAPDAVYATEKRASYPLRLPVYKHDTRRPAMR